MKRLVRHSIIAPALFLAAPAPAQAPHPGAAVYAKWCAQCHGTEGKGDGVAAPFMLPRPRDFTQALYQIRTTPSGALPLDADILRIIDEGMPGTAMPGWKDKLSRADRDALVSYLKTFSHFFAQGGPAPEAVRIGKAPRLTSEAVEEGRALFEKIECWKCHGRAGRGDGPSAPTLRDDNGVPIRAADLTQNWRFNGGGKLEDIYTRLRTGLDGTPMPSFSDLIESGVVTEEQLWQVAQYVRSLSPAEPPRVREVVRAALVQEHLPTTPDDSAWAAVESFYIPLVGQIVVKPRWFSPSVSGVWVQALHDGQTLALRLRWSDPSNSPDSAWAEWQTQVTGMMEPRESAPATGNGFASLVPAGSGEGAGGASALPDAIAVQFPATLPTGAERPYFLAGSTRSPVYLWYWQSRAERAVEARGRGMDRIEPLPPAREPLEVSARHGQGEWQVVFRRSLVTDSASAADRLQFRAGEPIPVAFLAWDGSNGESGSRAAISTWYFVYLDQPTPATTYAAPAVAMLLTAGLGLMVVGRAQRRERQLEKGL